MTTIDPTTRRRVHAVHVLRAVASILQVGVMVALYVMWKHYDVPFWTAAERCLAAGFTIYSALGFTASILLTVGGLQPFALLMAHLCRLAAVLIFVALRYLHGMHVIPSLAAWLGLYIVATLISARLKRRARGFFGT